MENLIGKKVKFVRVNEKNEVQKGDGTVQAMFIGPDKRLQVRVNAGLDEQNRPRTFNIDAVAINPTAAGAKEYVNHLKKITDIADKANEASVAIAKAANAEIEALNVAYLGEVINAGA